MKFHLPPGSLLNRKDFTFGVATSAFQIEGGVDSRLPNIWDAFCEVKGAISDNSNGDIACRHIDFWQQDIDLIESLGVDAYRFSISWPRVMNLDGSVNQQGLDFYIQILDTLKRKNIKAFVTLYHWDLPLHLENQGGWLNRETAYRFAEYAEVVSKAFGDRVYSYATLNEPWCSAYLGYEIGVHAPGIKRPEMGKKAIHHLLLAHGLALQVLNRNAPDAKNGIVLNFTPCYADSDNIEDKKAAEIADTHFNHWYIQPLMEGRYPKLMEQLPEDWHPDIRTGDMEVIAQPMDYLGINYYTRAVYRACNAAGFVQLQPENVPTTDMGWEVYPQGFTDLLVQMHERYQLPPVYITENGAATVDELIDGQVEDIERISYFQSHLEAVHQAVLAGVNIQGYFAWSLMDNFEWALGYEKRFGLVHVDYPTQTRTIKNSGLAFRQFLQQRVNPG